MKIFIGFRTLDPDPAKAMALIRQVKAYPYAQREKPPATRLISPDGKKWYGGQPGGLAYWERLHTLYKDEPIEERDRFFAGWLETLGLARATHSSRISVSEKYRSPLHDLASRWRK